MAARVLQKKYYWIILVQITLLVTILRLSSSYSSTVIAGNRRITRSPHEFRGLQGLLVINESAGGRHPIYDLIARAEYLWEEKLATQSRTLRQACDEYERRYNRHPPKGFDQWWRWASQHDVLLRDEYDQIDVDMEKYWAVPPEDLQDAQMKWEGMLDTFTIGKVEENDPLDIINATLRPNLEDDGYVRAMLQVDLMQSVQQYLPPFRATWTAHDGMKAPTPRRDLIPAFTMSKTTLHADILGIPVEGVQDADDNVPWAQKTDNRVLWRGSTTGMTHAPHTPWNMSQRERFVQLANRREGSIPILPPTANEDDVVGEPEEWDFAALNDAYFDVAFTAAIQCSEPAICEHIRKEYKMGKNVYTEEAKTFKFVADLDGNGWSSRFRRLMLTNSLVLKSTIFPEWWMDRGMPWVHFVPFKMDYSDLYDVLAFFRGTPDGQGAHDDLAEKIATAGRAWTERFWRQDDVIAYMWRLYLEYVRVMSVDRASGARDFVLGKSTKLKKKPS
ncbi:hypothetical protein EXIGLDRAFT_727686 [Exidia glandulosa HHB12029]|uniref:Glycosyl transferase CAP10 domain-containing protein n=1 Tax=Exidia glandulosa HHB12029 TaxID=1314781 RepID=A0A165D9K4_EXIGL|nr:hypothetical protein EXIGLDRAFT_727686 [Exidia glandulosa HHB12029]